MHSFLFFLKTKGVKGTNKMLIFKNHLLVYWENYLLFRENFYKKTSFLYKMSTNESFEGGYPTSTNYSRVERQDRGRFLLSSRKILSGKLA